MMAATKVTAMTIHMTIRRGVTKDIVRCPQPPGASLGWMIRTTRMGDHLAGDIGAIPSVTSSYALLIPYEYLRINHAVGSRQRRPALRPVRTNSAGNRVRNAGAEILFAQTRRVTSPSTAKITLMINTRWEHRNNA
jgi:hypothetical protein